MASGRTIGGLDFVNICRDLFETYAAAFVDFVAATKRGIIPGGKAAADEEE